MEKGKGYAHIYGMDMGPISAKVNRHYFLSHTHYMYIYTNKMILYYHEYIKTNFI